MDLLLNELVDAGYGDMDIENIFVLAFSIAIEYTHLQFMDPPPLQLPTHPPILLDPPPQPPSPPPLSPSQLDLEDFDWQEVVDWEQEHPDVNYAPNSPASYSSNSSPENVSSNSSTLLCTQCTNSKLFLIL